jgi:hypothetical protein
MAPLNIRLIYKDIVLKKLKIIGNITFVMANNIVRVSI